MAIVYRPTGEAAAIAQAGGAIGKAQRAEEDRAAARQFAMQQAQIKHSKEMAKFEAELRLQRDQQGMLWELEKENRAKAWDLEKMELRSRNDFMEEERERAETLKDFKLAMKAIDEQRVGNGGYLSDAQADAFQLQVTMSRFGKTQIGQEALMQGFGLQQERGLTPYQQYQIGKPQTAIDALREAEAAEELQMLYPERYERFIGEQEPISEELNIPTAETLKQAAASAKKIGDMTAARKLYEKGKNLGYWD